MCLKSLSFISPEFSFIGEADVILLLIFPRKFLVFFFKKKGMQVSKPHAALSQLLCLQGLLFMVCREYLLIN